MLFRIGLVFQRNRGLLRPFVNLARFGFGGKIGTGQQYISWIHESDFTALVQEAIEKDNYSGVYHAASPYPVTNEEFQISLRTALCMPVGLPTPESVARLGAFLLGTEPQLLLLGRRVVSKRLAERQFLFQFPRLQDALTNLLSGPKDMRSEMHHDRSVNGQITSR